MFEGRFGTKWSWEGPERLMNVYFVFLLELRALVKVAPYLQTEIFFTGNEAEDVETREAMEQLVDICKAYNAHYDESALFTVRSFFVLFSACTAADCRDPSFKRAFFAKSFDSIL